MARGTLLHLPFEGGAWEQDDHLMLMIGIARRAWEVFGFKPENKIAWNSDDRDFIAWVTDGNE